MHPMLKPALRRGWRSRDTVQFGVARAHAAVLGPMDTATGSFLELLDGTRGLPLLRKEARALGLPEERAEALVERLAAAGLLDDPTLPGVGPGAPPGEVPERLRPDAASLSVLHPAPGAAPRLLSARRAMRVQVRGAGRVGSSVAALLAASGVGEVDVMDGGWVQPADVTPGGVAAEDIGQRRDTAARGLVRRSASGPRPRRTGPERRAAGPRQSVPGTRTTPGRGRKLGGGHGSPVPEPVGGPGLTLVVLAPRDGLDAYAPDPVQAEPLLASGTPHLYAGVIEGTGVVGPLVLPGSTPCAGCAAAGRADREPGWLRMLAQWRSGRRCRTPACDTSLAAVVAGLTSAHALSFLDGKLPASAGARVELALPSLSWRPERIAPHPDCGCRAGEAAHRLRASAETRPHVTMSG